MTRQEENWEMMTLLHIPWHHAVLITDEDDRVFLRGKCEMVKNMMEKQREAESAQMEAESRRMEAERAKSNLVES